MTAVIEDRFADLVAGALVDPYPLYAEARAQLPIMWSEATSGWAVFKHDDVTRVLTDEEYFGPLTAGAGSSMIHGRVILHMEGVEHRKKSALLLRRLRNPRHIDGWLTDRVRDLSARFLGAIEPGAPIDLKTAFTTPLPLQITAEIMDIPEAPQFRDWYDTIVAAGASNLRGDPEVHRRGEEAKASLFEFLTPIIARRRKRPGDDLLSDLCTFEFEGAPIPDEEILAFCSFLLAAGVETTDRSLSSLLKRLVLDESLWRRLDDDRSLITAASAEILRTAPPVHGVSRGVRKDTTIRGQRIEAGQKVFAVIGSANRDEDHFVDSERFDVDRFATNPNKEFTSRAAALPFGAGTHFCAGSLLAKMEMVEATNALLDRFSAAEFVGDVPQDSGYVLRSPAHLEVRLSVGNKEES